MGEDGRRVGNGVEKWWRMGEGWERVEKDREGWGRVEKGIEGWGRMGNDGKGREGQEMVRKDGGGCGLGFSLGGVRGVVFSRPFNLLSL